jgi:hypothetical protein
MALGLSREFLPNATFVVLSIPGQRDGGASFSPLVVLVRLSFSLEKVRVEQYHWMLVN